MNLIERRDVTAATLQTFSQRPFAWRDGGTCVHLGHWHMTMMGHEVPALPPITSERSARRVLKERGWKNLAAMMDAFLPRITPAAAIVGDIILIPRARRLGALCVVAGNGRVMGYSEEHGVLTIMQPHVYAGAWRA